MVFTKKFKYAYMQEKPSMFTNELKHNYMETTIFAQISPCP